MSQRIILMRHGRPLLQHARLVTPAGLRGWIDAYDRAQVDQGGVPRKVLALARGADLVVSSSAARALSSLRALGLDPDVVDGVFREADLPAGRWPAPLLPVQLWAACFRLRWLMGYHDGGESFAAARLRARDGAARLAALAESGSVLLMGHGLMNRLIARELAACGWQGRRAGPRGYWSSAVYERA
jgi:broad specificity phosphatase PhoE